MTSLQLLIHTPEGDVEVEIDPHATTVEELKKRIEQQSALQQPFLLRTSDAVPVLATLHQAPVSDALAPWIHARGGDNGVIEMYAGDRTEFEYWAAVHGGLTEDVGGAWEEEEEEDGVAGDGDADEDLLPPPVANYSKQLSYEVLDDVGLVEKESESAKRLAELFGLPTRECETLLRYHRYDQRALVEAFLSNPVAAKKAAGLAVNGNDDGDRDVGGDGDGDGDADRAGDDGNGDGGVFECMFCLEDVDSAETEVLSCQHRCCNVCLRAWIQASLERGPACVYTTCPYCQVVIDFDTLTKYLTEEQALRLMEWRRTLFVEGARWLRWCPNPSCGRAVAYSAQRARTIVCECGERWCFGCGELDHRPALCSEIAEWTATHESEGVNANVILGTTKQCPACLSRIEKNQGCSHMTCRCRHEFCWLCMQDWRTHTTCDQNSKEMRERVAAALRASSRANKYIYFVTRYDEQKASMRFAEDVKQRAYEKLKTLEDLMSATYTECRFVVDAADVIVRARAALAYGYVVQFLLPSDPMAHADADPNDDETESRNLILEAHLNRLMKYTELLQEYVELPASALATEVERTEVLDWTRLIVKLIDTLEAACEDLRV